MQELLAVAHGNGEGFVHMHATNWIAHQPSRQIRTLRLAGSIRSSLLGRCGVLQQRAKHTAKQPGAPGNNEQPKQKPDDARKKCHGAKNVVPRWYPPGPSEVSVCKAKSRSQTKTSNFKGLRD